MIFWNICLIYVPWINDDRRNLRNMIGQLIVILVQISNVQVYQLMLIINVINEIKNREKKNDDEERWWNESTNKNMSWSSRAYLQNVQYIWYEQLIKNKKMKK